MKLIGLISLVLSFSILTSAQTGRPKILGIDHVAFYTTQADGVNKLYTGTLGLASAAPVETGETARYLVGKQWVGYSPAPDAKATDRMDHVALATDNVGALRRYLLDHGIKPGQIQGRPDHSLSFFVNDPEGHRIEFVERDKTDISAPPASAVSKRVIHAGFVVYHPDLEDHFYKEILGFRHYWHGGMTAEKTDWVALQVPDGTDWVEYMQNQPEQMDLRLTGVMNHVSLGVVNIKGAQSVLEAHGWKEHGSEKAQMGRDGKWQLNVYDPDLVRVELMEFKPAEKPCCSEFTGPHPSE